MNVATKLLMASSGVEGLANTDLFANALYTGNGSSQNIANGLNLSSLGGLVWIKSRSATNGGHILVDSVRGNNKYFQLNTNDAEGTNTELVKTFNSNGFTVGNDGGLTNAVNGGATYASWSFIKRTDFVSIVEWTGDGASPRSIAHGLGSTPAFFIIKNKSANNTDFITYHRGLNGGSLPHRYYIEWNDHTSSQNTNAWLNNTAPDATNITVSGTSGQFSNATGNNYIGYFFAHHSNSGTQIEGKNFISCGFYTGNGSTTGPTIDCQFDNAPRFIMIRHAEPSSASSAQAVHIFDSARGYDGSPSGSGDYLLKIETNTAESSSTNFIDETSSGFQLKSIDFAVNQSGKNYVYVAVA
tara:strand:- start:1927 stop:2994 length:1068 start_codon:yes stop_codon:yes gene_type:complete